jgi:hypothetical protein
LGDAILISKMTAASLWTFRISGIKNMLYLCVFILIVRDMLCVAVWKYSILWCGNFYVLFLFEFVNWGTWQCICAPSFFMRHGVFFCNRTFTCFAITLR